MIFSSVFCDPAGEGGERGKKYLNWLGSTNDPVRQRNEANEPTDPADDDAHTNDTSLLSVDKKARNNRQEDCLKYDPGSTC